MQERPLVFIDETRDSSTGTFALGALVMSAWEAMNATL